MRILVVCQHYWPEPFNTSDVCECLAARGHEVTFLTALPNTGMPGGEVPAEYRDEACRNSCRNGVRVIRVPLAPRRTGAINRIKNYLSFWANANKAAAALPDDYDVVLGYQLSPVMQVDPGLVYARKHKKKMLLYCLDLWPVSLTAGGIPEKSLPYRWMRSVSRRIYSQADRIAVTSPLFDEYFRNELGLAISDSAYVPQYAEDTFLEDAEPSTDGFDPEKINLTFAGNVGKAQSVSTIVNAAALLKNRADIVFHIVGSGSDLDHCLALSKQLGTNNVIFHGRKPVEQMPSYYAASDAMLVTFEESPMAEYTLPRKVTTYMAAGKPVIAAASGETKRVIEAADCGVCCGVEDAEGLAHICAQFTDQATASHQMGAAARAYYREHFTKERFLDDVERLLKELCEGN